MFDKKIEAHKLPVPSTVAPYLLYALHKMGGGAHGMDAVQTVGTLMKLDSKVLDKETKHGRSNFEIRVRFCMSHLRSLEYIEPKDFRERGFWYLSVKGRKVVADLENDARKDTIVEEIRNGVKDMVKRAGERSRKSKKDDQGVVAKEDEVEDSEREFEDDLGTIRKMDPYAFERLCVKLFKSVGEGNMEETKKSNDGGIDGFGFVEVGFVKFKVVMQAKRYDSGNLVQESAVSNFLGAMARHSAEKGMFITTSGFSRKAKELADKHMITLIDGRKLIGTMRDRGVGYKTVLCVDEI